MTTPTGQGRSEVWPVQCQPGTGPPTSRCLAETRHPTEQTGATPRGLAVRQRRHGRQIAGVKLQDASTN